MGVFNIQELEQEHQEVLYRMPALVSVLIGVADGDMDSNEEQRAKRAVHFRQSIGDPLLFDYFSQVEKQLDRDLAVFEDKCRNLAEDQRVIYISDEIARINEILPLLDEKLATAIVKNLRSLAVGIATTSGGIIGVGAGYTEADLAQLSMINF
jgi:hypothetical protein